MGEGEAGFALHGDVEHHQVGFGDAEQTAGGGGVFGDGDAKAALAQEAGQEGAEAGVVVDDQDVGGFVHAAPLIRRFVTGVRPRRRNRGLMVP